MIAFVTSSSILIQIYNVYQLLPVPGVQNAGGIHVLMVFKGWSYHLETFVTQTFGV